MTDTLYPVTFNKILQANNYTLFMLSANSKTFTIYTTPNVGENVQRILTDQNAPRPQTHDLIDSICKGFAIKPIQLVFHDVEETVYYTRLFFEKSSEAGREIVEIDTRPSDGLVIALMHELPMLCTSNLLKKI